MFDELVCPRCRGDLKLSRDGLLCSGCGLDFEIRDGVPLMWQEEFEEEGEAKARLLGEIRFIKKFIAEAEGGRPVAGAEEFWQRGRGVNYAARKIDERGFASLLALAPEVFGRLAELKILVVGCGTGKDAEWLVKQGAKDLVLADLSWEFVKTTGERLAGLGVRPRYGFQANAEFLPLAEDSFDLILFSSMLHHLPRPLVALENSAQIGGVLAACAEPSSMGVFKYVWERVSWTTEYGGFKERRFDVRELARFMENLGFVVKIKTDFIWFPLGLFSPFVDNHFFVDTYFRGLDLLNFFFGRWGHNFTMVAKRKD